MANVMVIEDNPDIAALFEAIFTQHQVRIFNDVPEAISFLAQSIRPDLVITDFYLPSGTGKEIANYMRSHAAFADVPILGVSVDDTLKQEAQRAGMTEFLSKPLDLRELVNLAARLITQPEVEPPPRVRVKPVLSASMRAALQEYGDAYRKLYQRDPDGRMTDGIVYIGDQPCDENWLRAEIRRLNSLSAGGNPKNLLMKLIDKLRRV